MGFLSQVTSVLLPLTVAAVLGGIIGMKLYGYAVASTVIILAVLIPLRRLEERVRRSSGRSGRPGKPPVPESTGEDDSTSRP
ncbi:MAG TPA: hypothetical protein GXX30_10365 [Firmicutes bacterium]|nr:hypothetical protein [Candidatus Fermentithermobacillaceae bacterium]